MPNLHHTQNDKQFLFLHIKSHVIFSSTIVCWYNSREKSCRHYYSSSAVLFFITMSLYSHPTMVKQTDKQTISYTRPLTHFYNVFVLVFTSFLLAQDLTRLTVNKLHQATNNPSVNTCYVILIQQWVEGYDTP